jgi:hypothetical protein
MAHLIKAITSDHDLIELADKLGVHLDDIYVSSELKGPIPKKGSFIILLRPMNRDIGHWTAVHNGVYFDSMGEGPPKKYGIKKYNTKQYQGTYDDYCGIYCLLWLYSKQHNQPNLFNKFHDLNITVIN